MRLNRSLPSLLPLLVGAISLGITGWLWAHEQLTTERALRADFDFSVRQTASRIEQRMASYEQMLRGVQGLFRASTAVDREHFDAYVDALLAGADFAAVQALAYTPVLVGPAGTLAPVAYIAPATGPNLRTVGDDAYADPVRRAAMLLARDSGGIGITQGGPKLVDAGATGQPAFVLFLPLYVRGRPLDTVAQRRAALGGWVSASVRMSDLMSSLYGEGAPGVEVRIHDGVEQNPRTLLYESAPRAAGAAPARFEAQEYIGFAGHTWTLGISTQPAFEQRHGRDAAPIIALSGIGLSLLLALLTRQLVTGRSRAHEAAKAMTRELRASEERYRLIVETADEGVWMTDARARTSFVNPKMARLLGYTPDEMIGRERADFSDDGPPAAPAGEPAPAPVPAPVPSTAERRESKFRRKDGSMLWASVATNPVFDAAGDAAGALAMVTDVTEKKHADAARAQLEAQLRESQKMEAIGTLAGGIAHDFNNILAAILGNAALAGQHAQDNQAALASLEQINKAAVRARGLVQQILAFSRRQPHTLVIQPLRPLVEESASLLRPILPALAELELKLAEAPVHIAADSTQLQQVLMNLCTNASHALKGLAGRITVGLDSVLVDTEMARRLGGMQPGMCAHLWVSDTGCGMDETTRARVFDPFFTTKPVGQGTGLGLSVVHGIVATHHGAIGVESAPGRGSRFDLYFPLLEPHARPAPVPARSPDPPPSPGQHVLYVDDDPVMVVMVQSLLQRAGYRVTCFEDPRQVIAALHAGAETFDLVVTDFNMPGLSGLDLARELARIRPGLPVVISSGYVSEDLSAAAAQAGVRSLVQKEYTLERLAGVVHRVLADEPGQAPATAAPDLA